MLELLDLMSELGMRGMCWLLVLGMSLVASCGGCGSGGGGG